MKQDENELFSNFVSRLKEAAIDCEFSVKCSKQGCGTTISYAEDMVRDQAVYGFELLRHTGQNPCSRLNVTLTW